MTNKEFMDYYTLMKGKYFLTKSETENVYKSKLSIEDIFKAICKELRTEKDSDDIIWRCCYSFLKLCNRHRISNEDLRYVLDETINLYHNNPVSGGKELLKLIIDINARSPLHINFDMFKINMENCYKSKIDGEEIYFRSIHNESEISYLKGKQYEIFACMIKDGENKIYRRGCNLGIAIKDILAFNYDKVYLSEFNNNDIDFINAVIKKNISMKRYFDIMLALGILELSLYINLKDFEVLRETKHDLIDTIGAIVKIWDITNVTRMKFLIKLNKHINDKKDLVRLNKVLQMFIDRIRLEHEVLTRIILSDWDTIDELIVKLTNIDLKKVYMIVDPYIKNDYYMIDNGISYAHITPGNICAREIIMINGDILVKKDKIVIEGGVKTEIDDILLIKNKGV